MSELTEREFEALAHRTLQRVVEAFDPVDPDEVEAVPSDGVVRLDFQGRRAPWVVNSQRGAKQIWLAADRQAWHFAHAGEGPEDLRWVSPKTGEELFETLGRLLEERAGVSVRFAP
ncbi:MAG: iron donor protein CyaY [Planctomycetota bacterium]|nr:MAG: iron donor protein CyaY [Planctomycetota bacterium]